MNADTREIDRLALRLRGLTAMVRAPAGIAHDVAAGVAEQTRYRLEVEKTSPDGRFFQQWSRAYARTRLPKHSILIGEHDLVDSIDSSSTARTATIFSDVVYAGVHQDGYAPSAIPARPYLGISEQNAAEISMWLGEALEALASEALA